MRAATTVAPANIIPASSSLWSIDWKQLFKASTLLTPSSKAAEIV